MMKFLVEWRVWNVKRLYLSLFIAAHLDESLFENG